MKRKTIGLVIGALAVFAPCVTAHAQDPGAAVAPSTAPPNSRPFFGVSAGVKGGIGGNYLDLRYAYNLTQPKDYQERTHLEAAGDGFTANVVASSTMDLRLLLGLAYAFGFGNF